MSYFSSLNVSASGLTAQRLRLDVISQNIANINTTRTDSGEAYRRQVVVFEEDSNGFQNILNNTMKNTSLSGVKVSQIAEDMSDFNIVFDPTHPDADDEGYVEMPNVNLVEEMTNMISANRSYEANVTAFNASKGMALKALEIGK